MEGSKANWIYSGLKESKMDKWIILHLRARLYLRMIVLPLDLLIGFKWFRFNGSEKNARWSFWKHGSSTDVFCFKRDFRSLAMKCYET